MVFNQVEHLIKMVNDLKSKWSMIFNQDNQWVKIQSKEPPKWMHTPQNYIFVCLKDHKGNIIVWIIIKKIGIISINYKVYMLKAWHKFKKLHVQNTQPSKVDIPYFFQTFFFSTKCAPFLLKIGKDFNIDY
jgi:hypothetical protein